MTARITNADADIWMDRIEGLLPKTVITDANGQPHWVMQHPLVLERIREELFSGFDRSFWAQHTRGDAMPTAGPDIRLCKDVRFSKSIIRAFDATTVGRSFDNVQFTGALGREEGLRVKACFFPWPAKKSPALIIQMLSDEAPA